MRAGFCIHFRAECWSATPNQCKTLRSQSSEAGDHFAVSYWAYAPYYHQGIGSRGMFGRRKNFWSGSAEIAVVAALYFVAAKGSLEFASINPSATPIWPPTGLALAAVMLRGYRILPGIFVGAFAANATTAGGPIASAVIALGNSLEAFVAALLMNRWAQGIESFRVPSAIAKFAAIVCGVSTPISATLGVAALVSVGAPLLGRRPGHLGDVVARRCGWRSDDHTRNRSLDAGHPTPAGIDRNCCSDLYARPSGRSP